VIKDHEGIHEEESPHDPWPPREELSLAIAHLHEATMELAARTLAMRHLLNRTTP
jgi:hypothetical protein